MPRVLIVDDTEENLYFLQALLSAEGYAVETARQGEEALELARRNPPDMVVSDLLMPVMDGFTLLRQWKADERLSSIPFIVFTATYTDSDDERLAMNLGADGFIIKPADPKHLAARLREVWADAAAGTMIRVRSPEPDEAQRLKLYSERLVRKLEERTERLGTAYKTLEEELVERQRAENERRKMLETQTAILNALPAHIALLDGQGVILAVNEAWRRFGGANTLLSDDFCIGQNYLDVCEQATGECADEAVDAATGIRRVLRGETKEYVIEYPCHSPEEQRWFRMMASPLAGAGNSGAVVMHVNITERKEAEQEIERALDRLNEAQRIGKIGDWDWDIATEQVNWSPQVYEILGRDPNRYQPAGFQSQLEVYELESQAVLQETVRQAIDTGEPQDYELEALHPSGRRIAVQAHAFPRKDENGRVVGLYGTIQDITDRKRAEEALRESEERFRTLLQDVSSVAVQSYALDGTTRYWNKASEALYGYSADEAIGRNLLDLIIPPEMRDWVKQAVDEMARTGEAIPAGELDLMRKDGSKVTVFSSHSIVRVHGREPEFFCIDVDMSERKSAELELSRTNRALKMLSGGNEVVTRAEDEVSLLENICRVAVESGGYRMAWVGYAQDDETRLIKPMAHAGTEKGYLEEIGITWDADQQSGQGPGGHCIRTGRKVVCRDIAADPGFAPWLEKALKRGYQALICLPLNDGERTFGMLSLYSAEVTRPSAEELKLLSDMAEDLAFGILGLRSRAERARTHEAVLTMARGLSASTGSGFFDKLTLSMVEALGGHAGHVARLISDESATVRTVSAVAGGRRIPDFQYTPDSERLNHAGVWVVERDVRRLHPRSQELAGMEIESYVSTWLVDAAGRTIGLISVQFQTPLQRVEFSQSMMRIFAARAASELERRRADARTREQAALLDKARDAIIVRDLEHRVIYRNKSAERLFGWTSEKVDGRPIDELLTIDPRKFKEADRAVRRSGEWSGELQKTNKDGKVLVLDSRWTLLRDNEGQPNSILTIDTDITERVKIDQHFRRAQRMESIGTLAGGIAHDLNNVLAPIMMAIDLLQIGEDDPERLEILSTIGGNARRGADMVRQVLSFARGVEGRRSEVDIGRLVREVEKIANETFLKHIGVHTKVPPDLWKVVGDATQLHQVLLNLCVNSRDAMPGGGNLILAARNVSISDHDAASMADARPGHYVCLQVEDNGSGMPPEVIEKIFDPFFTTKEQGKGTGLGLSTSLAIVRSHGGFIRIYSEPGEGTTFKVYLPAGTETSEDPAEAVATKLPRGRGELVLVVDDEDAVRQITCRTLELFGYRTVVAGNGTEALDIFKERHREIDMVLTDMMMPGMDGLTLIGLLREIEPGLRVVAASGLSARENITRSDGHGVNDFLPKPYTAETLLTTLRQVLEGK